MNPEHTREHPRAPGLGGAARVPARPAARLLATLLAALAALMIALPTARAQSAPKAAALPAAAPIAPKAPAPSPSPTDPGIGLGPGAPSTTDTAPGPAAPSAGSVGGGGSNPGFWDIPGQIKKAITDWFGSLVGDALTPMLNLLGSTLLGTPDVTAIPRVKALWTQMALLANALYILLVLAGAVIVTTHGTVQSRTSIKEIIPRLLAGMVAGNASIALLALMIHLSDALAGAILGGTIDPATAGQALGHLLGGSVGDNLFLILLDLGAQVMLIAILLAYIVRVAGTVILAVAAPLALCLHALPQTEHLARLWWRAITGVFLIQLAQSLTFVVALDVMLDPGAHVSALLGLPNGSALADTLVFLALCWILIKIPFWVGRSIFGRSQLFGVAKGIATYKLLGVMGLRGRRHRVSHRPSSGRGQRPTPPGGGLGGGAARGAPPPRPGGAGPRITVTQVHPSPPPRPRVVAGQLLATRAVPALPAAPGPAAAPPTAAAARPATTAGNAKPRAVQPGLFPPPPRTPRPTRPATPAEPAAPRPPRPAHRQPALVDRRGQITPAAAPTPAATASTPPAAPGARTASGSSAAPPRTTPSAATASAGNARPAPAARPAPPPTRTAAAKATGAPHRTAAARPTGKPTTQGGSR